MEYQERASANSKIVKRLAIAAVCMFGFGFALVPLYDVLCDITGLNGKTGRMELEQALSQTVDADREVTVEFLATVHSDLPWEFKPMVRKIKVHPGVVTEVNYFARNMTGDVVTGQAVPSVAPGLAAKYFSKTECFCFTPAGTWTGRRQGNATAFYCGSGIARKCQDGVVVLHVFSGKA